MKKNISINISGIIFHIEEDGYDQLKEYLESINKYFSTFEDSLEIIADIETRIAEIFLSKLKEGKQVIALEDVELLMATMGSIKDFQAAEEDSNFTSTLDEIEEDGKEEEGAHIFSKRLYRDNNRKLLAGVLSGIAFYFNIDPLWIRLLYVLLFFGVSILPSIAGFLFLIYIVLWIVIPASDELKEEKKIKKMYRDPDSKVLGGVASGIAAYFGVDVVIIRLLFFVTIIIAGTGLILYIILWIILPEAKTLTDKMEMQGQPVTLSNIESNIKKSLNVTEGEENIIIKILLFPFRLIAALFEFLSRALGPFMSFLVEALRVVLGALLAIVGISGVLGIISGGVLIGLIAGSELNIMNPIAYAIIKNDLAVLPGIALGMALIIPFFYLTILGFMVLMKKQVINAKAGWSLLAIWLVSIIILSFTIPPYIRNFQEDGRFTSVSRYNLNGKTAVFKFNDNGEDEFDLISLKIRSHEDTVIKFEQEFLASGPTRKEAVDNAKMIKYGFIAKDSIFTFDSSLEFAENAKFRKQHVNMIMYLPLGQEFIIDENMKHLIGSFMYREGYSNHQMTGNTWLFDTEGLKCITCPESIENEESEENDDVSWDTSGYQRSYEIDNFTELEISSAFLVKVKRGDEYRFVINGRKSDINDVIIDKTENVLSVDFKGNVTKLNRRSRQINVYIVMPSLTAVQFGSASKVYISGFKEDFMDISLHGAAFADLEVDVNSMHVKIEGASKLVLNGTGNRLNAKVTGASTLNAFDFLADETEVETYSASTARVYASSHLIIRTHGASNVTYKGSADVDIEKGGRSSVRRD